MLIFLLKTWHTEPHSARDTWPFGELVCIGGGWTDDLISLSFNCWNLNIDRVLPSG